MKARWIFLSSVVVLTLGALALAGEGPDDPSSNGEVGRLRRQVKELQARVQQLERQVETLQSAKPPRVQPPNALPGLKLPFGSDHPKTWGERNVNGTTVFTIPCGQDPL